MYEQLVREMAAEFPGFQIIEKAESRLQRYIHKALVVISLGQMRNYLTQYQTTLGERVYVTCDWAQRSDADRYIVLCHERIHLRQFRQYTRLGMGLLYLFVPLPIGLAYFRAHFEKEAYAESIRAAVEVYGVDYVREETFRNHIIEQFMGASYLWMWPFRASMNDWYDAEIGKYC